MILREEDEGVQALNRDRVMEISRLDKKRRKAVCRLHTGDG